MSTAMTPAKSGPSALGKFLGQENVKRQLQMALPRHMTVDRLTRVALTAAIKTPLLYECTFESIAACLLNAAQLGLEPNGRDAHLIPYRNKRAGTVECQLIPDYKGLIQLAYRSGMIDNLTGKAVYERDLFVYEFGTDERLKHVPCTEDNPGQLVYAWAMVRFKNGGSKFVVLNRRDIAKRKAKSQTANREDSPWNQYPEAMWAKSAVKELSKWIPQTPELQEFHKAVEMDTAADMGAPIIDATSQAEEDPEPQTSKSEALAEKLAGQHGSTAQDSVAGNTKPTNQLTDDESMTLEEWRGVINGLTLVTEVQDIELQLGERNFPQLLTDRIKLLCSDRIEKITGNRGQRSNKKLFEGQQSATEAGQ